MSLVSHQSLCLQDDGLENYTGITGSNTSLPDRASDVSSIAASVGSSLLSLAIVVGNGLIIMSVAVVKKLRQPANYLIVSLAVSDFLVGLIVLPMVIVSDNGGEWIFGPMMCDVHVSFDVICCTASIMNLCMISIDRYLMITKPMTYPKRRTGKLMAFMIATAWLISALIILPALFGFTENVKDSPGWLVHAELIKNGSTKPSQPYFTSIIPDDYPFNTDNNTNDFTKSDEGLAFLKCNSETGLAFWECVQETQPGYGEIINIRMDSSLKIGKLEPASFNVYDLDQAYKITKYRCSVANSNPNMLWKVLLQAETCAEEEKEQTNETFLLSPCDLNEEVYVTSDVVGRYVRITVNISKEIYQHGNLDCKMYGEKYRGKTCLISQEVWFTIYSTLGAFYLPLAVMLCMYWKIYVEASSFESRDRKQSSASYFQEYSESPSHNGDIASMNGGKYSSPTMTLTNKEVNINNNILNSKSLSKLSNGDSVSCFSDPEKDLLLEGCATVGENKDKCIEDAQLCLENVISVNEETKSKLSDFYIGENAGSESKLSCCNDSQQSKDLGLNALPDKTSSRVTESKSYQSDLSNSYPIHKKRKLSGPASFAPLNGIYNNDGFKRNMYHRSLSGNNILGKLNSNSDSSFAPLIPRLARVGNGVPNGESKFPPISENNVLELHNEQREDKKSLLSNKLQNSQTNDTLSSETSTSTNGGGCVARAYHGGPRYSIFSATPVYGARPLYCRHSLSSNRNFSNGAVSSYAKRRHSAGYRRTSSASRCSSTGSDAQKYSNKTKVLRRLRRRVSATSRERMRNVKATRTLGIIVGVFTFCWLPFFIVTFLRPFICEHPEAQDCIPIGLVRFVLWLGYVNSALNPLIYIGFSVDLRKSFCYLLSCKCRNVDRRLAQSEFRRAVSREKKNSITSHHGAAESIM